MKKKTLPFIFLLFFFVESLAQVTGDVIVCPGSVYIYSAAVPGAAYYNWTFPLGWYGYGQWGATVSVTCNQTAGGICAEGFDWNGNSVGIECLLTEFGDAGPHGWDVQPQSLSICEGAPLSLTIVPNGTGGGGCPAGCGSGSPHLNRGYAVYDQLWPLGNFKGFAGGALFTIPAGATALYVYYVDYSGGASPGSAIWLNGGCGTAVINNMVAVTQFVPASPSFIQSPVTACIGDTLQIFETNSAVCGTSNWLAPVNMAILSSTGADSITAVVTGYPASISFSGRDCNGCLLNGTETIQFATCGPPTALFQSVDSAMCPGMCADFTSMAFNATSWQWNFPGAVPNSSAAANPVNICYPNPGNYDVQLITANADGSDTLLLSNYMNVFAPPALQPIVQSGDTLFATAGLPGYQWYFNGNLLAGATDYFLITQSSGDYTVVVTDANGCEAEAVIFNVVASLSLTLSQGEGINLYPNPVTDKLTIESKHRDSIRETIKSISIYNILGEVVLAVPPLSIEEGQGERPTVGSYHPVFTFLEITSPLSNRKQLRKHENFIKQ